jgi:hypothetical protein
MFGETLPPPSAPERPPIVAGITIVFALLAIASLAFVVLLATGSIPLSAGALLLGGGLEQLGPLAFILHGTIATAIAVGLWRGWRWARLVAILFAAIGVLLDLPAISSAVVDTRLAALSRGAFQTIARVIVIYGLSQEPAKDWFAEYKQK